MRNVVWMMLGCTALLMAGCQGGGSENGGSGEEPSSGGSEVSVEDGNAGKGAGGVPAEEMTQASWDEVQAWVKQQEGKVVVVDVWSTFCVPCMKEFPEFVRLSDEWGDQVACASLNIDFYGGAGGVDDDLLERVQSFLDSNPTEGRITHFVSKTADSDVLEALDAAAIPVSLVFDQDGTLVKRFTNQGNDQEFGDEGFRYAKDVAELVESLLSP